MLRNKTRLINNIEFLDNSNANIVYTSVPEICIMEGSVFDIFETLSFDSIYEDLSTQIKKDSLRFRTEKPIITGLNVIKISWFDLETKKRDLKRIITDNQKSLKEERNKIIQEANKNGHEIYFVDNRHWVFYFS